MPAITEMFWVLEYNNNRALPEYDIYTGRINKYKYADHKNILRLWWLPITPQMSHQFPYTRYNPLLKKRCIELRGSKGYIARRIMTRITLGKRNETKAEKLVRLLKYPKDQVKCYVLGIEGGNRWELYPDGTVLERESPKRGETQSLLHG